MTAASQTEPYRQSLTGAALLMEIAKGELHELAGKAPQPDPPLSAPEPMVESDVLDTTVGMPFGCLQSMNAVKQICQIHQI